MYFACAGLRDNAHDSPGVSSKLGSVVTRDKPELLKRVRIWIVKSHVESWFTEVNSIQIELNTVHSVSVHAQFVHVSVWICGDCGWDCGIAHTVSQRGQLDNIASVQ